MAMYTPYWWVYKSRMDDHRPSWVAHTLRLVGDLPGKSRPTLLVRQRQGNVRPKKIMEPPIMWVKQCHRPPIWEWFIPTYLWWFGGWFIIWLVVDLPLWKIWVRQVGWWHSQYIGKIKFMFQTTNQLFLVASIHHKHCNQPQPFR